VVKAIASPRAGFSVEGEALKRRCTGRTASFGNTAIGGRAKRGVVRAFTTGCSGSRRLCDHPTTVDTTMSDFAF